MSHKLIGLQEELRYLKERERIRTEMSSVKSTQTNPLVDEIGTYSVLISVLTLATIQ